MGLSTQSVITVFLPSIFFSTGKRPEEQVLEISESRPESLEGIVLNFLQKGPLSKAEISRNLGHKHISGGLKKAICNLLEKGIITYTIPEKFNSRLQKYKLKKN